VEPKIRRVIAKYSRDSDELEGKVDVTHIPFDEIWRITQPDADDSQMAYNYRLNSDQLRAFQAYVSERLDVDIVRYEYFIEPESVRD
jgi:hypothetical protein